MSSNKGVFHKSVENYRPVVNFLLVDFDGVLVVVVVKGVKQAQLLVLGLGLEFDN